MLWTAAVRMTFKLAAYWQLTPAELGQLLGGVPASTLRRWRGQVGRQGIAATSHPAALNRMLYLIRIYVALRTLFADARQARGWLRRPNDGIGFDGRSALDRMLTGDLHQLQAVHDYLLGAGQ